MEDSLSLARLLLCLTRGAQTTLYLGYVTVILEKLQAQFLGIPLYLQYLQYLKPQLVKLHPKKKPFPLSRFISPWFTPNKVYVFKPTH